MMFNIEFFETDDGTKPVREFLQSLDVKMKAKVIRNLKHLQEHGFELREPLSAPLGDKLFELRTQVGGNITRVIYFFYETRVPFLIDFNVSSLINVFIILFFAAKL